MDFTARHFLLPLMEAQRREGFEVHLACRRHLDAPAIEVAGFELHPIEFSRSFKLAAHFRAYRQLVGLLRRQAFTVVHAHTPVAAMIARPAARRCGVPIVIYTAHGFYFHEGTRPWVRRVHIGLERAAQCYADFLFTQSGEDLETAVGERIAPPARAMAIGNGVDLARFSPDRPTDAGLAELRRELGIEPGSRPIVIMVARLVREKGYFEFLEAFSELRQSMPAARALLIGEALASDRDNSAEAIRAHVRHLDMADSVVFAGLRTDIPRLLALGDLFCLPSWREGMPRSIIEAMAAGLPVVATNIRGCREEVEDGRTGLLTPVRDAPALAQAMRRILSDEGLRQRMGEAGLRRARERFDENEVIERQTRVLRALFLEKNLAWPVTAGAGGAAPKSAGGGA